MTDIGRLVYFYVLDTFIENTRTVTWLASESGWAWSKHSARCSGKSKAKEV